MKQIGLFFAILLIFSWAETAQAGFGVSPGHIFNDRLYPGASFETQFILSRGNPVEDSIARISVGPPEIENWFTILPGKEILLPKGEQRVTMTVRIDVPRNAEYKDYKGYLDLSVVPSAGEREPGVTIVLGARVDADLTITKIKIIDFIIRNPQVISSEEGFHWWKIKLPAKVRVSMNVENIGNVESSPYRVEIEVWDLNWQNLIIKSEDLSLEKVKPFEKKDVEASFWLKLPAGNYWTLVRVFKDEKEMLREEKLPLKIIPFEMSGKDWSIAIVPIIFIIVISFIILWKKGILGRLILRIRK